jgi:outer membrane protein, multidrug efflux system
MRSRPLVFLMFATLSGCMGPRPSPPPDATVETPLSWRAIDTASVGAITTIDNRWWREFGDPTLNQLIDLAARQNDDQSIAVARVTEARAALKLARASLLPSVNALATGGRDAGISPFGLENQQTEGEFGASIAYDADIFGRLRYESAAAKARLLESAATRDAMKLSVAAVVAASYITLRALDARLDIAESTLRLRADSLQIAKRRYAIGYSTALDLKLAEAEYFATKQLIPELHLARTSQENALSLVLGHSPEAIPRGRTLEDLTTPALPSALPAAVVRQRPDIYAAEQRLVSADHTLSATRAAFLPNIQLEAGVGRAFSTLYPEPISLWSLGGSILAPIFTGGALRARQDIAAARRDQAAFAYRRTVLTAFREVEDQMTTIHDSDAQIQFLVAQTDALAAATRLATRRYRTGYSSYLDQLDAQRSLLTAQLTVVQLKANYLLAFVDLFRALGGGWIPLDTDNADIHQLAAESSP